MATGFNPSDIYGGMPVSGTGNTVAGPSVGLSGVRSITGHSTGKWYFEVTATGVQSDETPSIGISAPPYGLNGSPGLILGDATAVGFFPGDFHEIFLNNVWAGSNTVSTQGYTAGDTFSFCVDLTNSPPHFYAISAKLIAQYGANGWNGLSTANPAANVGGVAVPSLALPTYIDVFMKVAGGVSTLNTGQSPFLRTPPSGFSAWDVWGTVQNGQAFVGGAGSFSASSVVRTTGSAALAGVGSFDGLPIQQQHGTATLAGVSHFTYLQGAAILVSAPSSVDTAIGTLQGAIALLAGTGGSFDAGLGSVTLPSVAANTQQMQNALVDALLRNQPFLAPTTWYVALVTQLGSTTQAGTEVTGSGYARVPIAATLANFSGTQGAGSTVASVGTSGLSTNNVAVTFGAPTADWGTIIGYELWDAPAGGNRWMSGKLVSAVTIHNSDAPRSFAPGMLSIAIA